MWYATPLSPMHVHEAEKVMFSRQKFLNITDPEALEMQRYMAHINLRSILDPQFSSIGTAFGVWHEESTEMQALVITLFSTQQPCYYINKAYTLPDANLNVLPVALKSIMEYHEELGYKRFYALYSQTNLELYKRLWRKSALLQNYDCYTEYESAPNERPKFQEFWELLYGRMLYNEHMIVRAFIQHEHARQPSPTAVQITSSVD